MGKASRAKRERREQAGFVAGLTACEGTWLERPPTADEIARVNAARRILAARRSEAQALGNSIDEFNRFSLNVYRDQRFAPLYIDDWLIEEILERLGEPPVVEHEDDPAFSDYLRLAVAQISSARVRRALAEQSVRFLPSYVDAGQITEALAIEHNAYLTVMSDANTPLLVQMVVGGLARWYEEHEEEPAESGETADV